MEENTTDKINNIHSKIIENICEMEYLKISSLGMKIEPDEKKLVNISDEILEAYYNKEANFKKINENCFLETKLFRLLIFEHIHLFAILSDSFYHNSPNLKLSETVNKRFIHLTTFLTNQINNLKSSLLLLEHNLTQSTDILFRNYIETSEKALAILIDDEYFNFYSTETNNPNEEKKVWQKTKPFIGLKIIKNHFLKIEELKEFYEIFFEIRQSLYSKTSKAVHSHLESTITESLNSNDNEFLLWSVGGNKSNKSKEIFKEYIVYTKTFLKSLTIIMVKDYKLSFNKFENNGIYQIYINQVTEKLFKYYLEKESKNFS